MKKDVTKEGDILCAALSSAQLQQLFGNLPGIYFVAKNLEGRVTMANHVAVQLCGFNREADMIGKTDAEIFSPDRAAAYVEDDKHVFETGESVIDRVELAPDPHDAINWFVTTKIPLYSDNSEMVGLACIARNLTSAHKKLRPDMEMNEVLDYVRENYAKSIKMDELAEIVDMSYSQFERRFKRIFRITPARHVLNERVRGACRLLVTTNKTISSIATECGFYDHSHFIRVFRKSIGITPGEYRKEGRTMPW